MTAQDDFTDFWKEESKVPCNGCTKCCQGEIVVLRPEDGDDPTKYQTMQKDGMFALAHKENGDCVYLGEEGCTIYADRPMVCKSYDCRVAFLTFTRAMREAHIKRGEDGNFEEGKKRLHTLPARSRRAAIMVRKCREFGLVGK